SAKPTHSSTRSAGRRGFQRIAAVMAMQIVAASMAGVGSLVLGRTTALAASYSSTVLADSPLVYYHLDETSGLTAADSSGNGVTGTYASSSITYHVVGALVGDSDTAITTTYNGAAFSASSATLPSTGSRTVELSPTR